jgi:hypothetical protein
MTGRTIGNLTLMTLVCVVVFIVFMALRPARAGETPIYGRDGKYHVGNVHESTRRGVVYIATPLAAPSLFGLYSMVPSSAASSRYMRRR